MLINQMHTFGEDLPIMHPLH